MTYRLTIRSNKRIILLIALSCILPIIGVVTVIYLGVVGYIILGIGVLLSYQSFAYIRYNLKSNVVTHEDGITVFFPRGEPLRFLWQEITHAGLYTKENGRKGVFIYEEGTDKFVSIPDEYEDFASLHAEIEEHIRASGKGSFYEFSLGANEDVKERLRSMLGVEKD